MLSCRCQKHRLIQHSIISRPEAGARFLRLWRERFVCASLWYKSMTPSSAEISSLLHASVPKSAQFMSPFGWWHRPGNLAPSCLVMLLNRLRSWAECSVRPTQLPNTAGALKFLDSRADDVLTGHRLTWFSLRTLRGPGQGGSARPGPQPPSESPPSRYRRP